VIIRFEKTLTVSELLGEIRKRYGTEEKLRRRVGRNPRDILAMQDLEDLRYYIARPKLAGEMVRNAVSVFPVNDAALALFTPERLRLLDVLSRKSFASISELAYFLGRDVKNVHDDLSRLAFLHIVEFDRGSRNARIPRLSVDSITVLLGEVGHQSSDRRDTPRRHRAAGER